MATRIYVGNLPYSADSDQLTQMFSAYGEVVEATIVMDRDSGQSKGFGFVQMGTDESASSAIAALNGTTLGDRSITVNEAKPRPERTGGGYRSGGGGRGGYSDRPRRDDYDRDRRW